LEYQGIDQVILNYLQGEATANEIEFLRKWISDHEDNESIFESVKTYWENSHLQVKSADLDKSFAKLNALSFQESITLPINISEKRKRKFNWYKCAAIFIVFFTVVGMIYFANDAQEQKQEIKLVQEVIKENPKGQKLTTFLPDGSKVILNSQSKIKYHTPFNETERYIELEGEAFFEVKKDDQKTFRVVANGVSTTALGTSFNVNSKNRNFVEVALVSGKVRVSNDSDHTVILSPGKFTTITQYGDFEISDFEIQDKVGWKDGLLVFKNNTLSEIVARLEDWYGVNFITIGALETDFHYSGKYNNETLEEVLYGISFVHHFEFKISGDTVKIYSNHKM
jgi:transmembrane sensor